MDETTEIRVFSLGNDPDRVDPALILNTTFSGNVDGIADLRSIRVVGSENGSGAMKGIDAANANFTGFEGSIGIRADGIRFLERLALYDLTPLGIARPRLRIDPASMIDAILVTGGDLAESVGEYRIDTNGVAYSFPIRSIDGRRSISKSPLRTDLGDGVLPAVKDTFVAHPSTYFLKRQDTE